MNENTIQENSSEIEITATLGRREIILATLRRFKEDGTGTLERKKYRCANKLAAKYQKSDLKNAKRYIESQKKNGADSAAIVGGFGAVLAIWISTTVPEKIRTFVGAGLGVASAAFVSFVTPFGVAGKDDLLDILEITLDQKTDN